MSYFKCFVLHSCEQHAQYVKIIVSHSVVSVGVFDLADETSSNRFVFLLPEGGVSVYVFWIGGV